MICCMAQKEEEQSVCPWLFLTASLSCGICIYGLLWTIRWFFWLVDQPVLPAHSWLWHSVLRRPDAEPGHTIPLSFEPALVSTEISLHVFWRWTHQICSFILYHSWFAWKTCVFPSSKVCCLSAQPWITASESWENEIVRIMLYSAESLQLGLFLTEEHRETATEISPTLPGTSWGTEMFMDHVCVFLTSSMMFWIGGTWGNRPTFVCKTRTNRDLIC